MLYYKDFMLENNYVCVLIYYRSLKAHISKGQISYGYHWVRELWVSFVHCDFLFSKFFELACMILVLVLKIHTFW